MTKFNIIEWSILINVVLKTVSIRKWVKNKLPKISQKKDYNGVRGTLYKCITFVGTKRITYGRTKWLKE